MNDIIINNKMDFLNLIKENPEDQNKIDDEKNIAYHHYTIQKKTGVRHLYSIKKSTLLYKYQKNLYNNFLSKLLFPECVYGFRKERSYFDFLVPHISSRKQHCFLRLDISNFFESIQLSDVKECFKYYLDKDLGEDEKEDICEYFLKIVSYKGKIVQGAITSPAISNLVFRRLDIRIIKYCKKFGITYSRYADDLLFSCHHSYVFNRRFITCIRMILNDKGFSLNNRKTLRYTNEVSLNGYVIGEDIRLSRKKLSKLNKLIFELSSTAFTGFENKSEKLSKINELAGYRAFLINALKYYTDTATTQKINKKILLIENTIDKARNMSVQHV